MGRDRWEENRIWMEKLKKEEAEEREAQYRREEEEEKRRTTDENGFSWWSNAEKEKYAKKIQAGAAKGGIKEEYYEDEDEDDPRPHGYEILDKNLRVLDEGVEKLGDFAERLYSLGFGYEHQEMVKKSVAKNYQYAAYLVTNGSEVIRTGDHDWKNKTTDFFDGWDSSYHDANWNGLSMLAGYGATPEEATERRNKLVGSLIPSGDPSIKRFKLRQLVRPGD